MRTLKTRLDALEKMYLEQAKEIERLQEVEVQNRGEIMRLSNSLANSEKKPSSHYPKVR